MLSPNAAAIEKAKLFITSESSTSLDLFLLAKKTAALYPWL